MRLRFIFEFVLLALEYPLLEIDAVRYDDDGEKGVAVRPWPRARARCSNLVGAREPCSKLLFLPFDPSSSFHLATKNALRSGPMPSLSSPAGRNPIRSGSLIC